MTKIHFDIFLREVLFVVMGPSFIKAAGGDISVYRVPYAEKLPLLMAGQ